METPYYKSKHGEIRTLIQYAGHVFSKHHIKSHLKRVKDYNAAQGKLISETKQELAEASDAEQISFLTTRMAKLREVRLNEIEKHLAEIIPLEWSKANLRRLFSDDKKERKAEEKRLNVGKTDNEKFVSLGKYREYQDELLFIKFLFDRDFDGIYALLEDWRPAYLTNRGIGPEYLFAIYLWCKTDFVNGHLVDATFAPPPQTNFLALVDTGEEEEDNKSYINDRLVFLQVFGQFIHYSIRSDEDFKEQTLDHPGFLVNELAWEEPFLVRLNLRINGQGKIWKSRWVENKSKREIRPEYQMGIINYQGLQTLTQYRRVGLLVEAPISAEIKQFACLIPQCQNISIFASELNCFCSNECYDMSLNLI